MTSPVLIPTMVPLADYQRHMLTTELRALSEVGALSDALIDGARIRFGATQEEAQEIVESIRREVLSAA